MQISGRHPGYFNVFFWSDFNQFHHFIIIWVCLKIWHPYINPFDNHHYPYFGGIFHFQTNPHIISSWWCIQLLSLYYYPFIIIPLLFIHHYPITIPLLFDYYSTCIPLNLQEIAATSLLNFHPSESEGGAGATDGPDSGGGPLLIFAP